MTAPELPNRADVNPGGHLTPEEAAHRLQLAREALRGIKIFDRMSEDEQAKALGYTADVVAIILLRHGGRFRRTSSDVSWSALSQGYSPKTADTYPFGRFRKAFDDASHAVYKTLYAMLEAGVNTREALDAIGKPPPDPLQGLGHWLSVPEDSVEEIEDLSDIAEPPLPDELVGL
jgi:hypothetical protein